MKRSKWFFMVALLMSLSLIAAACGGDEEDPGPGADNGDCQWTIGTIGALTGDSATVGQPILRGIQYGIEAANEQGDLPCELVLSEQDSQGDPAQAPPLAQTLAQTEDLVAIVGPYFSGETDAVGDTFDEAGITFACPSCTNPDLSGNGWTHFFRLVGTDAQQGEEAARYLTEVAGVSSVAIMHDNSEYGKPLADTVAEHLGDAVVANVAMNPEETDHSAALSKVAEASPDAVFFGGYQPEFSEILKQGTDQGLDVLWTSGDGSKAIQLTEDQVAQGAVVFCPCDDPQVSTAEGSAEFAAGIREFSGEPPGTYAVEGYDGVFMMVAALLDGGYDGDSDIAEIRTGINEFLHSTTYEGISKTFEFDETGEIGTVSIFAYQVEGDGFNQLGLVSEL